MKRHLGLLLNYLKGWFIIVTNTTCSTVYTYCPTEATWPSEGKPRFPVQKNTSVLSFSFIQTTDWQVSMPCGTKFLQLLQFFE